MIDKLTLQIPFARDWVSGTPDDVMYWDHPDPWERKGRFFVDLALLPFKKACSSIFVTRGEDGSLLLDDCDIFCPWESISSGHGGLAMKVFDMGNSKQNWPYIEIKCSPAKLSQGHNVWGWDDLRLAASNMFHVLCTQYPWLLGGFHGQRSGRGAVIDQHETRVREIDITYSARVPSEKHRKALIRMLNGLSKGQTKARGDSYETTAYFGAKNSRLKKIKVYLKGPEATQDNDDRKRSARDPIPDDIVAMADNLVRFEATIKSEWMARRGMITKLFRLLNYVDSVPGWYVKVFRDATSDLFEALSGQEIKIMNDDVVVKKIEAVHGGTRGKSARVFGFYQSLRAVGFDTLKEQYPKSSWCRMVSDLEACGFSRALLCSLNDSDGSTVVMLPDIITIDGLGEYRPPDAVPVRLWQSAA